MTPRRRRCIRHGPPRHFVELVSDCNAFEHGAVLACSSSGLPKTSLALSLIVDLSPPPPQSSSSSYTAPRHVCSSEGLATYTRVARL
eukprot:2667704-Pyramimonas_sp.AAC.1